MPIKLQIKSTWLERGHATYEHHAAGKRSGPPVRRHGHLTNVAGVDEDASAVGEKRRDRVLKVLHPVSAGGEDNGEGVSKRGRRCARPWADPNAGQPT